MTVLTTAPDTHFLPQSDAQAFGRALGSFATGVIIVTTDRGEGPIGIVSTSFSPVSLDPAMVLWCAAKASHRFEHFSDARRFAIHVLRADQLDIYQAFKASKTAFSGFEWSPSHAKVPLIHGVSACFECNLETSHDAGDHTIVIGSVTRAHHSGGAPLILHEAKIGNFSAEKP